MNKKELIASALDTHLANKNAIRRAVLTAPAPKKSFWRPFLASAAALCVCVAVALGILNLPREEPDIPVVPVVSNSSGTTGTTISPTPTDPVLQEDVVKYYEYFSKNHYLLCNLVGFDDSVSEDTILRFCMIKLTKQSGRDRVSAQELKDAAQKYFGYALQNPIVTNQDIYQIEGTDQFSPIGKGYSAYDMMVLQSLTQNPDGSKTAVFLGFSGMDVPSNYGLTDEMVEKAYLSDNLRLICSRFSPGVYLRLHFTEKEDEYGMYLQYHSIALTTAPTEPVSQEDVVKYYDYFEAEQLSFFMLFSDENGFTDTALQSYCLQKLHQITGKTSFEVGELQEAAIKYFGKTITTVYFDNTPTQNGGTACINYTPQKLTRFRHMTLKSLVNNDDGSKTAFFHGYAIDEDETYDPEWNTLSSLPFSAQKIREACLSNNQRILAARHLQRPSPAHYFVLRFTEKEDENGIYLQYHSMTDVMPAVPAPEGITMLREFPLTDRELFGYVEMAADADDFFPYEGEFLIRPFRAGRTQDEYDRVRNAYENGAAQVKAQWDTAENPVQLKALLQPIFLTDSVCSFSISGSANATGAAYPQNVYRTFTYDTVTGQQLRLADLCEISPQLVSLYRRRFREQAPEEQANLLDRYTDEQLLEELRNADQTGSLLQSYLTTDGIGIVFPTGDNMDQRIQTIL